MEKIAEECKVDLIDAVQQPKADLSDYDRIGFASGIYFSKFHQTILKFASENLPENKKVFMICTYGGNTAYKSLEVILKEKKTDIIGKFGCKGYDTFGPFKLLCTRQKKNTKIRSCFVKNGQKYWSVYLKFVTIVTECEAR